MDLARLAGLAPAGVLCEVVNEDGTMARMPDLERFAEEHGLLIISIADLIAYRRRWEKLVTARDRGSHPDVVRLVQGDRLRVPRRPHARRARQGRPIGQGERPRARALRVLHR